MLRGPFLVKKKKKKKVENTKCIVSGLRGPSWIELMNFRFRDVEHDNYKCITFLYSIYMYYTTEGESVIFPWVQ